MSYLGVNEHIEAMCRKLCIASGLDPDYQPPDGGYWSYEIGSRAWMPEPGQSLIPDLYLGSPQMASKKFVFADGPPQWVRFYAQAKGMINLRAKHG